MQPYFIRGSGGGRGRVGLQFGSIKSYPFATVPPPLSPFCLFEVAKFSPLMSLGLVRLGWEEGSETQALVRQKWPKEGLLS